MGSRYHHRSSSHPLPHPLSRMQRQRTHAGQMSLSPRAHYSSPLSLSIGEEAKQQVTAIAQAQYVYIGVRRTGSKTILTSHCIHITYRNTELGSVAMAAGVEAIVASFAHDFYFDPILVDLSQIRSINMCDMCGDTDHRALLCSKFDSQLYPMLLPHNLSQLPTSLPIPLPLPSRLTNFSSRIPLPLNTNRKSVECVSDGEIRVFVFLTHETSVVLSISTLLATNQ